MKYGPFDDIRKPVYKQPFAPLAEALKNGVEGFEGGGAISDYQEMMRLHVRKLVQAENDLIEKKLEEALVSGRNCGVTVKRRFLKDEVTEDRAQAEVFIFVEIDEEVPFGHIHYETEY